MGVVMSINVIFRRFSLESNIALIDTNDFLNGAMDSRWAIITFGNYSGAIIVHNCPVGIYPYFNEWWSASSMKVMYVDGILFPTFVTNMTKLVFHLDNPCADIRH